MSVAMSTAVTGADFDTVVAKTRETLKDNGFGVLTEIDMAATLKKKLDVDIPPQVILGACNPPSAYQAVQAEPSIGVLLPCNVVVRSAGEGSTIVEAIDPATIDGARATGLSERQIVAGVELPLISLLHW